MNSLESIEYNTNRLVPQCLNELNSLELQDLKTFTSDFFEILTTKYVDKTFCIQTDYDYMFGNISYEKAYFYFADAEDAILKDWSAREGQPHYTLDKSYIHVYRFSELKEAEMDKREKIIHELQVALINIFQ